MGKVDKKKDKQAKSKLSGSFLSKFQRPTKSSTNITIDSLPYEILCKIFSYLSKEDLYYNVRSVCQKWRIIGASPDIWTTIEAGQNIPTELLNIWLQMAPRLKTLKLDTRQDAGIILKKVVKTNKNIEEIELSNCWGATNKQCIPSEPLCNIVNRCPYLTKISLLNSKTLSNKLFKLFAIRTRIVSTSRGHRHGIIKRKIPKQFAFSGQFLINQLRIFLRTIKQEIDPKTEVCYITYNGHTINIATTTEEELEELLFNM